MDDATGRFNYPLVLNLRGRLTVVVGAGKVGQRKLERLLQAGAKVRLIDPDLAEGPHPSLSVESIGRGFEATDLRGAQLVFACTDSPEVNRLVAEQARCQDVLCCRADQPKDGDFSLPAVLERGDLTVAISTGGGSPALAAEFRDRLAEQVPDSWGFSLALIAEIRRKLLTDKIDDKYNQQVLRSFWIDRLLPLVEKRKVSEINLLLIEVFGDDFSLERLQVQLPEGMV